METVETKQSAKPVERLMDVSVEVTPPHYAYGYSRDPERIARCLEDWAKDLVDFVRDHRSQDSLDLNVVRDVREVCSLCGRDWETIPPDDDDPNETCAWCGAPVGTEGV